VNIRKSGNKKTDGELDIGGFLCRGGLPECQWMNIPEAFFIR
jgi:hypothetical protein